MFYRYDKRLSNKQLGDLDEPMIERTIQTSVEDSAWDLSAVAELMEALAVASEEMDNQTRALRMLGRLVSETSLVLVDCARRIGEFK
jgi:hypothetical protein